jgi:hypothetical protein
MTLHYISKPYRMILVIIYLQILLEIGGTVPTEAPYLYIGYLFLYSDRKTVTSLPSPGYVEQPGGYIFQIPWRRNLDSSTIEAAALALYEIQGSPFVSYTAEMLNFSSIGSTLTFNPYGVISGITKASFSLVVMSSSNSNF